MQAGQRSRVYFQATDAGGKPANVEGELLENGRVTARIAAFNRGFGRFELVPNRSSRYQVRITKPAGIETLYDLPRALENGANLQLIRNERDYMELEVNTNQARNNIYVVGASRGIRLFTYRGRRRHGGRGDFGAHRGGARHHGQPGRRWWL